MVELADYEYLGAEEKRGLLWSLIDTSGPPNQSPLQVYANSPPILAIS